MKLNIFYTSSSSPLPFNNTNTNTTATMKTTNLKKHTRATNRRRNRATNVPCFLLLLAFASVSSIITGHGSSGNSEKYGIMMAAAAPVPSDAKTSKGGNNVHHRGTATSIVQMENVETTADGGFSFDDEELYFFEDCFTEAFNEVFGPATTGGGDDKKDKKKKTKNTDELQEGPGAEIRSIIVQSYSVTVEDNGKDDKKKDDKGKKKKGGEGNLRNLRHSSEQQEHDLDDGEATMTSTRSTSASLLDLDRQKHSSYHDVGAGATTSEEEEGEGGRSGRGRKLVWVPNIESLFEFSCIFGCWSRGRFNDDDDDDEYLRIPFDDDDRINYYDDDYYFRGLKKKGGGDKKKPKKDEAKDHNDEISGEMIDELGDLLCEKLRAGHLDSFAYVDNCVVEITLVL